MQLCELLSRIPNTTAEARVKNPPLHLLSDKTPTLHSSVLRNRNPSNLLWSNSIYIFRHKARKGNWSLDFSHKERGSDFWRWNVREKSDGVLWHSMDKVAVKIEMDKVHSGVSCVSKGPQAWQPSDGSSIDPTVKNNSEKNTLTHSYRPLPKDFAAVIAFFARMGFQHKICHLLPRRRAKLLKILRQNLRLAHWSNRGITEVSNLLGPIWFGF